MKLNNIVRNKILDITPYEPGEPIEEVKKKFGLKKVIKLASNENPLGPSKKVLQRIREKLQYINRYPDVVCYNLRKNLASQWDFLNISNFIIGNGSNEILELVLRAFVNPGEEVISCHPTFLIYEISSKIVAANYIEVPLDENFKYDLEKIKEKITEKTKVIFISNPNNPTGTYIRREELLKFLKSLPSHLVVVLDEAYSEFVEGDNGPFLERYVNQRPFVITRTFSKAYGLSGLRVGYGIASGELLNYLNRVSQPFNVNMLAQEAASAVLQDKKYVNKTKHLIWEQKKVLYKKLEKMGLEYVKSQTNFILINIKENSKHIYSKMIKYGVIVRPMEAYDLPHYIRVTIGTPEENEKFIEVLKKVIK